MAAQQVRAPQHKHIRHTITQGISWNPTKIQEFKGSSYELRNNTIKCIHLELRLLGKRILLSSTHVTIWDFNGHFQKQESGKHQSCPPPPLIVIFVFLKSIFSGYYKMRIPHDRPCNDQVRSHHIKWVVRLHQKKVRRCHSGQVFLQNTAGTCKGIAMESKIETQFFPMDFQCLFSKYPVRIVKNQLDKIMKHLQHICIPSRNKWNWINSFFS